MTVQRTIYALAAMPMYLILTDIYSVAPGDVAYSVEACESSMDYAASDLQVPDKWG